MNGSAPATLSWHDTWLAAQREVVAVLASSRTQLEVTGPDAAKFLQSFFTNHLLALQPGQGAEGFFCNVKGRVLGHVTIFLTPTSLWMEGTPGQEEAIIAHLSRFRIREQVEFLPRSEQRATVLLLGPGAVEAAGRVYPTLPAAVNEQVELAAGTFLRRVTGWPVECVAWSGPAAVGTTDVLSRCLQGLEQQAIPLGTDEVLEPLRIQAGFPRYGADITEDNLAQEVNRNNVAISFRKGCYLGQEPIARIDALGHVNRVLTRWTAWRTESSASSAVGQAVPDTSVSADRLGLGDAGTNLPVVGAEILDATNQTVAGKITSSVCCPDGMLRGLAYLKTKVLAAGAGLVTADGWTIAAAR